MALSDSQMQTFEDHFKKTTKRPYPMCDGKKFEYGYETLIRWKVDAKGGANLVEPDWGRILAFVECMACNYYMYFNPQKMGVI